MITLQFQHMSVAPFDTMVSRKRLYDAIAALPGVKVEERLNGRPSFSMVALAFEDNLERFIGILDGAVDQMLEAHKKSAGLTAVAAKSLLPR